MVPVGASGKRFGRKKYHIIKEAKKNNTKRPPCDKQGPSDRTPSLFVKLCLPCGDYEVK